MNIKVQEGRKFNFTIVDNEIIDKIDRFTKSEVLAYMVLARYANSDDSCFPSYSTIAAKMRCSKRTAIDAIDSLEIKGVIKKQTRKNENNRENNTNIYKIMGIQSVKEVAENIANKRKEKSRRAKQIKELNEHPNVKLMKEMAPHIRMGRMQKIELIDLDYETLQNALDRSLVHGANTLNYILMAYNTILEEIKENKNNEYDVPGEDPVVKDFTPNFEFKRTEMHEVAYINYMEKGFDSLTQEEVRLLIELEEAGIVDLSEIGA